MDVQCFICLLWIFEQWKTWLKTQTLYYPDKSSIDSTNWYLFNSKPQKYCQLLNAKTTNHPWRLHFRTLSSGSILLTVCFPSCCKWSQRVLRRGHWMRRGWRGKCKGASLTGDEGYMKDTYSASLGTGENRWCYDSRASLQRLFSTNVHLGGQLAVTSASACWEGASQWENLDHQ